MDVFQSAVSPLDPPSPTAWQFNFVAGKLLLPGAPLGELQPQALSELPLYAENLHYLGRLRGVDCWTASLEAAPAGWRAVSLRGAMQEMSAELMSLVTRAAQIIEWDRTHRYCGACGTPTVLMAEERCRNCPACNHVAYPRLSPVVMALVWRDHELLLARSPNFSPGVYSALAGFVEVGESLEDCVHREVAEEVGVCVDHLRYYGSQSWPFPHNLMVAYTAEWQAGDIVPQAGEIEDAQWFSIDALPTIPPRFSIAGHLIRDTVAAMGAGT